MAETITTAPARASREATQPMRAMFASRSSFEKPRPFERCVRMMSPSRWSTTKPRRSSSGSTLLAIVVLPAPERPVNQRTNPLRDRVLGRNRVDAALGALGARPAALAALAWLRGCVSPIDS
jgi:hypothetical protein